MICLFSILFNIIYANLTALLQLILHLIYFIEIINYNSIKEQLYTKYKLSVLKTSKDTI